MRDEDLKKVYGHAVDLTGFEDQNQLQYSHGQPSGMTHTVAEALNRQKRG
jgi:hypothetical protein